MNGYSATVESNHSPFSADQGLELELEFVSECDGPFSPNYENSCLTISRFLMDTSLLAEHATQSKLSPKPYLLILSMLHTTASKGYGATQAHYNFSTIGIVPMESHEI